MNESVNNFVITDFYGLSDIYEYPCSGYAIYKGVLILIYDRHAGYINPINYPQGFLKIAKEHLFDDWTYKKVNCSDDKTILSGIVSNHSGLIKFKGKSVTFKKYYEFSVGQLFYGKDQFRFTDYYNLDNFRTICPYIDSE